jgi:hypothetical protein
MHTLGGQVSLVVLALVHTPISVQMDNAMLIAKPDGHLPIMMRLAMDRVAIRIRLKNLPPTALIVSTQGLGRTLITKIVRMRTQTRALT